MITVTLTQLQQDYLTYLQSQNSKINAFAPNTYWSIQAGAMSAFFLDLYGDLQLIENSIYVQNSVGTQCDQALYANGLPARGLATYGTISCTVTSATPITIPINTVFIDSVSSNQYQNLQAIDVLDGAQVITLYAVNTGSNVIESNGATLTNSALSIDVIVTGSTNGQNLESDQSCITRLLQAKQTPPAGSRTTDYFDYALESDPQVTWALVYEDFQQIGLVNILGVFPLVGTFITEYQLNEGLLPATLFVQYSRLADPALLTTVNSYIQSQRLVGISATIGPCLTYDITNAGVDPLELNISLVSGYSLSTILLIPSQDNNDNPITIQLTVEQVIQREVRRAICNQQFGATLINNQNTITVDSLISSVNAQLSYLNGQIAQILTNIAFPNGDIAVPNLDFSNVEVYYVYDVDNYSSIVVNLI